MAATSLGSTALSRIICGASLRLPRPAIPDLSNCLQSAAVRTAALPCILLASSAFASESRAHLEIGSVGRPSEKQQVKEEKEKRTELAYKAIENAFLSLRQKLLLRTTLHRERSPFVLAEKLEIFPSFFQI
jgi:hypothetical protein